MLDLKGSPFRHAAGVPADLLQHFFREGRDAFRFVSLRHSSLIIISAIIGRHLPISRYLDYLLIEFEKNLNKIPPLFDPGQKKTIVIKLTSSNAPSNSAAVFDEAYEDRDVFARYIHLLRDKVMDIYDKIFE